MALTEMDKQDLLLKVQLFVFNMGNIHNLVNWLLIIIVFLAFDIYYYYITYFTKHSIVEQLLVVVFTLAILLLGQRHAPVKSIIILEDSPKIRNPN